MTADTTAAAGTDVGGAVPPFSARKHGKVYTPEFEAQVKRLRADGWPRKRIAAELGCSIATVDWIIYRRNKRELPSDAVERYNAGESENSIAKEIGCRPDTALRMLAKAGARVPLDATKRRHADIIHRYTTGRQSIRTIAKEVGRSYHTVRDVLLRAEIPLRPQGGYHRHRASSGIRNAQTDGPAGRGRADEQIRGQRRGQCRRR